MRKETSLLDGCAVSPECLLQSRFEHWACVSAEVLPDAAELQITRDLKQPNRLVITANHDGGRIVREARRWLSVWRGEAKFVSLLSGNFSTAQPQQASQDHLNVFWQYFLFIAEEIRSVGKQNPQTCCLWVKLVNVNYVAWGAAVWLSKKKTKMLFYFNIGLISWALWTCVTINSSKTKQ